MMIQLTSSQGNVGSANSLGSCVLLDGFLGKGNKPVLASNSDEAMLESMFSGTAYEN